MSQYYTFAATKQYATKETLKQTNHKILEKWIWKSNGKKTLNKNVLNEHYQVRKLRIHDIKILFLWATNQIPIGRLDL